MKTTSEILTNIACIAEIIYPIQCPVCQKIVITKDDRKMRIHHKCYLKLKRVEEPMCKKCGKQLLSTQQEYCYDCMRQKRSFESGHGLWRYDVVSSASVFAYKYNAHREYALFYAEVLIHFYKDWITALGVQQIIPVPISRQKKRKKGFNHAELLAEQLGDALGIPVNHRGLIRIHSTAPQKELGKEERRKNLEKAFRADIKYLPGIQRVLLVDDIYTTGSTIEFCTRALKAVGVKKVWFLTLCIGSAF